MIIRQAETKDLDFIIDCIIESEKSGGDIFPYSEAFGISVLQFSQIFRIRRWANTASSEAEIRNGSIPMSTRRVTAPVESFVWRVVNTK